MGEESQDKPEQSGQNVNEMILGALVLSRLTYGGALGDNCSLFFFLPLPAIKYNVGNAFHL